MKPVKRSGYVDLWIIVQQANTGTFILTMPSATTNWSLGVGFYATLEQAQHAQTLELLKNNKVEIFHLEWPIK